MTEYLFVVQDKNKKIINKTQFICNIEIAKDILNILMHQTGVRYGYILEKTKDLVGNMSYNKQVYDSIIVHEGE